VYFRKLSRAAGLFLVAVLRKSIAGDGFAIWHARLFGEQAGLEFSFSLADRNVDMLVTHALQDGLVGAGLLVPREGHIFFHQAGQGWG